MIQDYLMMITGIMFSYSLIPQIIKIIKNKSAKDLSWSFLIITFIGMSIITGCMLSLKLYFSFMIDIITSLCYLILIILKTRYKNNNYLYETKCIGKQDFDERK